MSEEELEEQGSAPEPTLEEFEDDGEEERGADYQDELSEVRDILFGSQARNFGRKLERIEQRINQQNRSTRDAFNSRLDELERYFKDELDSLADRIQEEQNARASAIKEVASEMRDLAQSFDGRCEELAGSMESGEQEIRDLISEQSSELGSRLREITRKLEKETRLLQDGKADRNTLAEMLGELAGKLSQSSTKR